MRRAVRIGFVLLFAGIVPQTFAQNAPGQPADKTIAVFGQTIHYWDVGSGPVVVMVHGLGSRKEEWLPVVEPLSKSYRLLIPDQIGFGHSDKPLLDYSIQTYVDFMNEFLRDLKVEKANFVGESLGGWICGVYAVELSAGAHLVPIEKLILVDAAGLKQDKAIPDLNPSSLAAMRGVLQAVFFDTSWLDDNTLRKIFTDKLSLHDGYTVRSFLSNPAVDAERLDGRLANIKVPTLVLWGKQDALLPIASGERYSAGIADARLVSFDKCGHIPATEQSEAFVSTVTQFLSGTSTAH